VGGSAATAQFNNDQTFFDALINNEFRIWYRIEWSAATMEQSYQTLQHSTAGQVEHFLTWPANMSNSWNEGPRTSCWSKNPGGTIRWIQRLSNAPTNY
jgi:hypothetical protein